MTTALEQALYYYERVEFMDEQARLDAAVALDEWGVFSSRQVSAITGLEWWKAAKASSKTARTGGRLDPKSLAPLRDLAVARARGEMNIFAALEALSTGTSVTMAVRLTGIPATTLKRWKAQAERLKEEA